MFIVAWTVSFTLPICLSRCLPHLEFTLTLMCSQAAGQVNCHCSPISPGLSSAKALRYFILLLLVQPFTLLFIKKHISGGRTVEATMELEAH